MNKTILIFFAIIILNVEYVFPQQRNDGGVTDTVALPGGVFMSEVGLLNLNRYATFFLNNQGRMDRQYRNAATSEDFDRIAALGGEEWSVDTPLEIALLSNAAGVVNVRPVEASQMLGNPRQAALKLGAAVFMEIQILRFLGNTRAVGVHEAELKFITDRGCVTRAQIETFYRNGIRGLVSDIVDEQFVLLGAGRRIMPNTNALSNIKNALTEFMLAPNEATYRNLLLIYQRGDADNSALLLGLAVGEINAEISIALATNRVIGTR
jgi:hypothetical protein